MKTKLMYVADDGTSFDTEKECIDYEKTQNEYVVLYSDKDVSSISKTFSNEIQAKRFIADCLHMCYKNNIISRFKLIHCGKTVEFNSDELSNFVPAHYNIDGNKLNEVFQLSATKEVKIPGYTLHGDYYLSDKIILNKNWKEACEMRNLVILPNGKTVIAHILSKEELETIPEEERKISENGHWWYWTSTPDDGNFAYYVLSSGDFHICLIGNSSNAGGVRLGFKNPFIN